MCSGRRRVSYLQYSKVSVFGIYFSKDRAPAEYIIYSAKIVGGVVCVLPIIDWGLSVVLLCRIDGFGMV
jgi:hypothetical protein